MIAAFLAAGRGTEVGMLAVLSAVKQEMSKLGQRARPDQFGRWAKLLETERDEHR